MQSLTSKVKKSGELEDLEKPLGQPVPRQVEDQSKGIPKKDQGQRHDASPHLVTGLGVRTGDCRAL